MTTYQRANQSSSPPDSSDDEHSDSCSNNEDDEWYNLPSDADSDDEIDEANTLAIILPIRPAPTSTELVVSTVQRKEHSIGARIKAVYMLEELLILPGRLAATDKNSSTAGVSVRSRRSFF
jgi:hypothetical protein